VASPEFPTASETKVLSRYARSFPHRQFGRFIACGDDGLLRLLDGVAPRFLVPHDVEVMADVDPHPQTKAFGQLFFVE